MPKHCVKWFHNAYTGVREFGRKIEENHLVSYANQLTLSLILAFFPFVIMFVPARRVRFRAAFPGALFTTVAWTALTLLFQYYVDNFADYSLFYGALGTMVALLLWVQLISAIILLGVEINALLLRRRGEQVDQKPDLTAQG